MSTDNTTPLQHVINELPQRRDALLYTYEVKDSLNKAILSEKQFVSDIWDAAIKYKEMFDPNEPPEYNPPNKQQLINQLYPEK